MNEAQRFGERFGVSRETSERLEAYATLLARWNARINLIGRSTADQLWTRHIADSAQLWRLAPEAATWADLGAGAGFPGLVIAAIAHDARPTLAVTLVESDTRKCAFLVEAARVMEVKVKVCPERIEALPPLGADVVSARALAPLETLLSYAVRHRSAAGIGLFPKGETVHKEIEAAARKWRFEHKVHPSVTDSQAAIVEVGAISSV